jgi:hypothetical protein
LQSHRKRNDVAIDEFPQDLLADILRRQHCHSELNHRTINHFFEPCRAQAEQQCSKM